MLFPRLSVAQSPPRAVLLPEATYTIEIKRVYGGNDGTKDIIPAVSSQRLVIETQERESDGMPVKLTVYRSQQTDNPKGYIGEPAVDWTFSFRLTMDAEIADLEFTAPEDGTPESTARKVLIAELREALFLPAYEFPLPPAAPISVTALSPDGEGRVAVAYKVEAGAEPAPAQDMSTEPLVTTVEGTATYDNTLQCYPLRTRVENTKMYIPSDAAGTGTKIVTMQVKSTYLVTVTKH